jgi:hypothetical protein
VQAFAKGGDSEGKLIALCRSQYYYFVLIITKLFCHLLAVTKFTIISMSLPIEKQGLHNRPENKFELPPAPVICALNHPANLMSCEVWAVDGEPSWQPGGCPIQC